MTRFNPFPGLRPFEADEDHLFFGRARETDELLHRLRTTRFLAVVGGSGSGKSSLVRSGLIPSLYSGFMTTAGSSWRVAVLRPGNDPIGRLSAALLGVVPGDPEQPDELKRMLLETTLRRSASGLADCVRQARIPEHENVLVVVDQFEELFRFKQSRIENSRNDAVAFVKLLIAGAHQNRTPLYVVLTMRSDFIGDCMEIEGLPEAINEGQYLVPRMTRSELREAIVGPVKVGGGEITPRLVVRLLNDVGDDHNQLPVLQHALMRSWDRWQSVSAGETPLDLPDYEDVGTMAEALSRHADEAYQEIAEVDAGKRTAELVFKSLTDTSSDPRGVRRPASIAELSRITGAAETEIISLVERFRRPGRTFLMPSGVELESGSIVDLSHESLMRRWRRLIDWAQEEKASALTYRRLAKAATRHEQGTATLWRGTELFFGLEWREENRPTAEWAERNEPGFERAMAFLDASKEEQDRLLAEIAKQRKRKLLAAILVPALAMIALFGLGWLSREREVQRRSAEEQRYLSNISLARSRLAQSRNVDASKTLWKTPEAQRNWEWGHLLTKSHFRELAVEDGELVDVAFSPDVDRPFVATASAAGTVTLWEPRTATVLHILEACPPGPDSDGVDVNVELSYDGRKVLASCDKDTGPTRIWDTATGKQLAEAAESFERPALSADGRLVLAIREGRAELWQWGQQLDQPLHFSTTGSATAAAIDADGEWIAIGSEDGELALWDVENGVQQTSREAHDGPIADIAFSADGARLVTRSGPVARIWRLQSPGAPGLGPEATLEHESRVLHAAFGPDSADGTDGAWLATVESGNRTRVWEVSGAGNGEAFWSEVAQLEGPAARHAVFSPDAGRPEILVGAREEAVLWNWRDGSKRHFKTLQRKVVQTAFSADGKQVLTRFPGENLARVWQSDDATLDTWWRAPGRERVLATEGPGTAMWVVTVRQFPASSAWGVRLWQVGTEEPLAELVGHEAIVNAAALSRDRSKLLTSSEDATIVWTSSETGAWSRSFTLDTSRVQGVAFSPDGERIVTAGEVVRLWDAETGAELAALAGHEDQVLHATFGPSGRRVITSSADGTARIWDGRTGIEAATLIGHDGRVTFAAFSADGRKAVTTGEDWTARLWDTENGRELATLGGHENTVMSADFSPDGTRIVTASKDKTVRIWNNAGIELASLPDRDELKAIHFGPQGRDLLVFSDRRAGVVRVLPFRADQLPGDPSRPWKERLETFENELRTPGPEPSAGEGPE